MNESIFRVRFYKDLPDSKGHTHKCIQGEVQTAAPDQPSAVVVARLRFAKQTGVTNWSLRADYETVETLPTYPGAP